MKTGSGNNTFGNDIKTIEKPFFDMLKNEKRRVVKNRENSYDETVMQVDDFTAHSTMNKD